MRRLAGAACALALVAGYATVTAGSADADAGAIGGIPVWLAYDRPAEYATVAEELRVPMRDGAQMRCTKVAPALGGVAVGGKFPVVVTNFFAYRALQQAAFAPMANGLAERGYVTLSCSPRGTGGTLGTWRPFEAQEARDNYDIIEWAAIQAWSNGRVGQTGISYGGISTYKAIAQKPPHLLAAVPIVAYNDMYKELVYPGGQRGTTFRWWPYFTWGTSIADQSPDVSAATLPQFADFETRAQQHPLHDAYWKSVAIDNKAVDKANVPTLAIGGWSDLFPQGMVRNYLAAKDTTTLLMLPGAHLEMVPGVPQFDAALHAMLAWFDRILKQRPGTPEPGAKVTSWEMPRGLGNWVEMNDWPTKTSTLSLSGAQGAGSATQFTYTVNPFDNGCSCVERGAYNSADYPFNDQRVFDEGRVRFDGAPLGGDLVIAGAPVAHIKASLSSPTGTIVVRLQDVGPDGTSTVITSGWLNANHRQGHDRFAGITPGTPYVFDVELLPTHWRLRAGHFLRITVSSGDVQTIEPTAPAGSTVNVFAGKDGSTFDMPFYNG